MINPIPLTKEFVTADQIRSVLSQLPPRYLKELSRAAFGRCTEKNKRRIKYWRTGQMRNQIESLQIYRAAQEILKKYQAQQESRLTETCACEDN